MSYIVIECHGGPEYATIVVDDHGENMIFTKIDDALLEVENCQDGRTFEI